MTLIEWDEGRHLLGVDEMDYAHQQFTLIVNRLGETMDPSIFRSLFIQLLDHTQEQFAFENRLMEETNFSRQVEHMAEHDSMLRQMHNTNEKVQSGKLDFGHAFVTSLPHWFNSHADSMDSLLAQHIKATS